MSGKQSLSQHCRFRTHRRISREIRSAKNRSIVLLTRFQSELHAKPPPKFLTGFAGVAKKRQFSQECSCSEIVIALSNLSLTKILCAVMVSVREVVNITIREDGAGNSDDSRPSIRLVFHPAGKANRNVRVRSARPQCNRTSEDAGWTVEYELHRAYRVTATRNRLSIPSSS